MEPTNCDLLSQLGVDPSAAVPLASPLLPLPKPSPAGGEGLGRGSR
jgi:hypothetical protein